MKAKIFKKLMTSKIKPIISWAYINIYRNKLVEFINEANKYSSFKHYFKEGTDYKKLFKEYLYLDSKFGCTVTDYLLYEFYRLSEREMETYITNRRRYEMYQYADVEKDWHIFGNKEDFFDVFKEYMSQECIFVSKDCKKEVFEDFCRDKKMIIIKPVMGERGQGIQKLLVNTDDLITEAWENVVEMGETVQVESVLRNCKEIELFHPESLNSIRLSIVIDSHGEPHILAATLRTGSGNNYVDNGHSGGVYAALDPDSGLVISCGYNAKGEQFIQHPDSNIVFEGTKIPCWETLIQTAKDVSKKVPTMRYIGWDWILNEEYNWVLIEGNEPGGIDIHQHPLKRGLYREYSSLIYEKEFCE